MLVDGVAEENKQKSSPVLSPLPLLSRLIVVTKDIVLFWSREVHDVKQVYTLRPPLSHVIWPGLPNGRPYSHMSQH